MIANKHITKITIILIFIAFLGCFLAMIYQDTLSVLVSSTAYQMEYETKLFDTSEILDINIVMDDTDWNEMLENARQEQYFQCDVSVGGETFYRVGIRPKGNTSLSSIASDPENDRYSFKLEFDQFVDGQTCFGLDKLILNNSYADTTYMKEAVIYDMYQFLGADASLYNYANLSVNGEYFGVYLALEAVEESFMLRNFGTEKGYLYKPDSMNHNDSNSENEANAMPGAPEGNGQRHAEGRSRGNGTDAENAPQKTQAVPASNQKQTSRSRSMENAPGNMPPNAGENNARAGRGGAPGSMGNGGNLNYTDDDLDSYSTIWDGEVNSSQKADHQRVVTALKHAHEGTELEKYLDVDNILKYMAVHNFSVNDDSLSGNMAHNYYLYEANGTINLIPWDYNLAFGGMRNGNSSDVINEPIDDSYGATKFFDALLENEEYKARYHAYYNKLIEEYVYGGQFHETYQRIRTQIDALVQTDPNAMYSYEEYLAGADMLYNTILLRAESVSGQLAGTIPSTSSGQREDTTALIDASQIDLSVMGQFMGGGRR